jgi:hypothetical protein
LGPSKIDVWVRDSVFATDSTSTTPLQRRCNERVSVDAAISSAGETGGLAEIETCMISLKMAVSPRDENG